MKNTGKMFDYFLGPQMDSSVIHGEDHFKPTKPYIRDCGSLDKIIALLVDSVTLPIKSIFQNIRTLFYVCLGNLRKPRETIWILVSSSLFVAIVTFEANKNRKI